LKEIFMIDRSTIDIRTALDPDRAAIGAWLSSALDYDDDAVTLFGLLWEAAPPDLRVVVDGADGPIGVALGSIRAATGSGHVDLIAVMPWARGRGVGTALLEAAEQRLRAAGANALFIGGNTPTFAWPGIDIRYTPAICLAESRGYAYARQALNMTVDLLHAPLDTVSDETRLRGLGVHVRRLRSDEARPGDLFDSWVRGWGGTWQIEAARAAAYATPRIHVAVRDGRYVGFACHGVNRTAWFGPMGTDESERGNGIGAILLRRCLADMRDAGIRTAEIAWVGPHKFYARAVGAVLARAFWIYRKDA
jgi:mycothiol synthase